MVEFAQRNLSYQTGYVWSPYYPSSFCVDPTFLKLGLLVGGHTTVYQLVLSAQDGGNSERVFVESVSGRGKSC